MARFFVLGNCQVDSVAKCLRALHPEGYVEGANIWNLLRDFENEDRLLAYVRTFDFVVLQDFGDNVLGVLDGAMVKALRPDTLMLPGILFSAFHPDIVYVQTSEPAFAGRRIVPSAIGDYHSALTVFGYLQGLSVERTISLFRAEVYRALGYLSMWPESESFLLDQFRHHGWPADEFYGRWVRRGAFMHSINHPKLHVCADIARMILKRCQIKYVDDKFEDALVDPLLTGPIWPLYPEVAALYGLAGSMHFKRVELDDSTPVFMTLLQFVNGSYEELENVASDHIDCPRVRQWMAEDALAAFL
jgi:Polysaccharide biosynthesis enzyme WcbI